MRRSIAAVALSLLLLSGCAAEDKEYSSSFFAMDTYMTLTAYGDGAAQSIDGARAEIERLESLLSVTDEGSEIYAVNQNGGGTVSDSTEEIVKFSLEMAERTEGALDPTIYPIVSAWGFTGEEYRIPSAEELSLLLERIGYEKALLENGHITLKDCMMLDLGAVAKGYAGDRAAKILKEQGVTSALLDIGGNVQAVGCRPDGSDWRLGLRDPLSDGLLGVISVSDLAVVTSGGYERYFVGDDEKRYCHIIDPHSGYPADNGLLSVTVIAPEGAKCDALSTALFVMGAEGAVEHWRKYRDFDMILVSEGEIRLTNGVAERFELRDEYSDIKLVIIE